MRGRKQSWKLLFYSRHFKVYQNMSEWFTKAFLFSFFLRLIFFFLCWLWLAFEAFEAEKEARKFIFHELWKSFNACKKKEQRENHRITVTARLKQTQINFQLQIVETREMKVDFSRFPLKIKVLFSFWKVPHFRLNACFRKSQLETKLKLNLLFVLMFECIKRGTNCVLCI
jgi:hypothetical protein